MTQEFIDEQVLPLAERARDEARRSCCSPALASIAAATPQATLPDVEDEVMCVACGTALNISQAPSADAEREFIRRRIAEGLTKDEIKDALVAEYGPEGARRAAPVERVDRSRSLIALAALAGGGADRPPLAPADRAPDEDGATALADADAQPRSSGTWPPTT